VSWLNEKIYITAFFFWCIFIFQLIGFILHPVHLDTCKGIYRKVLVGSIICIKYYRCSVLLFFTIIDTVKDVYTVLLCESDSDTIFKRLAWRICIYTYRHKRQGNHIGFYIIIILSIDTYFTICQIIRYGCLDTIDITAINATFPLRTDMISEKYSGCLVQHITRPNKLVLFGKLVFTIRFIKAKWINIKE